MLQKQFVLDVFGLIRIIKFQLVRHLVVIKIGIGREVYKDAIKTINKLKTSLLIQVMKQKAYTN